MRVAKNVVNVTKTVVRNVEIVANVLDVVTCNSLQQFAKVCKSLQQHATRHNIATFATFTTFTTFATFTTFTTFQTTFHATFFATLRGCRTTHATVVTCKFQINLRGMNLAAIVHLVLDCDADGFKCLHMISCVMVEGLLQNGEELQAAVQTFLARLDARLKIIELWRLQMVWKRQLDVIVRSSLVSADPVTDHLLSHRDLAAQPPFNTNFFVVHCTKVRARDPVNFCATDVDCNLAFQRAAFALVRALLPVDRRNWMLLLPHSEVCDEEQDHLSSSNEREIIHVDASTADRTGHAPSCRRFQAAMRCASKVNAAGGGVRMLIAL
jgi:hypothetical protein